MLRRSALALALSLLASGCCTGGTRHLTMGFGVGSGHTSPPWSHTASHPAGAPLVLSLDHDPARMPSASVIEVYEEASLRPVTVRAEATEVDNASRNGCGLSRVVTYDLSALAAGRYVVVHRRSQGNGDPLNCTTSCPWTTFEGESALVFTLVLTAPP